MSLPPPPPPAGPAVCYRHPDRETGRRCTRCGRAACSECLVQATVGSHCLDCAKAARPDVRTRAKYWQASQPAIVTNVIIAINVAVFVYLAVRDPATMGGSGPSLEQAKLGLFREALQGRPLPVGVFGGTPLVSDGNDWYRLVTSGFIHFGIIHIGFNMYLLYVLGRMLEPAIGRVRFALVYFAALLGGSALVVVLGTSAISGGASGAVFGLMGVAAVGYWQRGINPLSTQIGSLLMLNLVLTFLIRNISIGAHLGGLIAGAACGLAVMAPAHRRPPVVMTYLVPIAISVLSVAVAVVATR